MLFVEEERVEDRGVSRGRGEVYMRQSIYMCFARLYSWCVCFYSIYIYYIYIYVYIYIYIYSVCLSRVMSALHD